MFRISNNKIQITRGDTGRFSLAVMNGKDDYNYSSDTVVFTVKRSTYDTNALIQKTISYGNDVLILPSDTSELEYGEYVYDVQLTTQGGAVDTIITPNKFVILPEVSYGS